MKIVPFLVASVLALGGAGTLKIMTMGFPETTMSAQAQSASEIDTACEITREKFDTLRMNWHLNQARQHLNCDGDLVSETFVDRNRMQIIQFKSGGSSIYTVFENRRLTNKTAGGL